MANVPVNLQCSFCGKSQHEVRKLIAGPTVYICDECIGLCNDIIADELGRDAWIPTLPLPARVYLDRLLERASTAAGRLQQAAESEGMALPVDLRAAIAELTSGWREVRAAVERVDEPQSEAPEWLQPVLGLLTRIGGVLPRLREQARALGLAQWEPALEESQRDLSTAIRLLRAQASDPT